MPDIKIAHLNIQNVNVVIAFLNSNFDREVESDQQAMHNELQLRARTAGLAGNVVLVWTDSQGQMKFRAPAKQHPFFRSVSYNQLYRQVNKKLSWN